MLIQAQSNPSNVRPSRQGVDDRSELSTEALIGIQQAEKQGSKPFRNAIVPETVLQAVSSLSILKGAVLVGIGCTSQVQCYVV